MNYYIQEGIGCVLIGGAVACFQGGSVFWILLLGAVLLIAGISFLTNADIDKKFNELKKEIKELKN